jgi:hypothetical protein
MAKTRGRPFENRTQIVLKKWPFQHLIISISNGHCIYEMIWFNYRLCTAPLPDHEQRGLLSLVGAGAITGLVVKE